MQNTASANFIHHTSCNDCGSSDALGVYDDGSSWCFSCGTFKKGDTVDITPKTPSNTGLIPTGEVRSLPKRKLNEETCRKFGYTISEYQGQLVHVANYKNSEGKTVAQKIRFADKSFKFLGAPKEAGLYGEHLWREGGKMLVITEGEIDALSMSQAQGNKFPVVSLPNGAQAAKKAVQKNYEFLQGYENIILWFDNDEAGCEAAKAAAGVLPPGKVSIARLSAYKDLSDAWQANDRKAIDDAYWAKKPYRPDGIVEGKSLLKEITTPNPPNDHDYPFQGLQQLTHGIRYGELVTITAGSGIGKSSFCRELATSLLQKGERVGYLALEESNRRTALGLMSAAVGKSLHLGEHDHTELVEAFDSTIANWNLFLFDGFGSYDPDVIYNRIEYLASGLDCKVIFLDHLSILLSGLEGDERRMIDSTMTKLRSLVERTGIALFLVSHLRRSTGDKNHEEGARVTLGQLRGSAAIAQLSDSVIGLERDQQSDKGRGITTVRVLKNRYSGETGVACALAYDLETCKFEEHEPEEDFDPATDF